MLPATATYYIHISDEIREFTERIGQGHLTHNKADVDLDVLTSSVKGTPEAAELAKIISVTSFSTRIIRPQQPNISETESIRLRSSERHYQGMIRKSVPTLCRKEDPPDCLAIELKGSLAMAISLLMGLFLSFATGWLGGPFIGLHTHFARAILGLILLILFMAVEVSLILVRYAKLDRIQTMRNNRVNQNK